MKSSLLRLASTVCSIVIIVMTRNATRVVHIICFHKLGTDTHKMVCSVRLSGWILFERKGKKELLRLLHSWWARLPTCNRSIMQSTLMRQQQLYRHQSVKQQLGKQLPHPCPYLYMCNGSAPIIIIKHHHHPASTELFQTKMKMETNGREIRKI